MQQQMTSQPTPGQDVGNARPGEKSQQRGDAGKGRYPANKEDVDKFLYDIMQSIHSEKMQPRVVEMLSNGQQNIGETIGLIAGQIVMSILSRRSGQDGRKPHISMVINGMKKAVIELAEVANEIGLEVAEQDLQTAAAMAGKVAEDMASGGGQNGGAPAAAQPPAGMLGQMQQPPQSAPPQIQQGGAF
ncbi:MAG: hypothetical protein KZQ81_14260 [Candidatus Thiodiazotropha sp. (ex Rostrolucina anterorostrata)]|nr:hypothetical protein [Candidatus Thiodiazotropha sp. (ex Rostrolucina anterorostrata)]